ncbi:MAG: glycosyltransferase [Lachnoclostridium sp.]|nr:glycosyltransferase [Lachnoclostridium sp.]
MEKNIIYLTQSYPSDIYSEKNFITPELESLRKEFKKIVLLPIVDEGHSLGYENNLPEGVTVDWSLAHDKTLKSYVRRLSYLFHPFVRWSFSEMKGEAHGLRQWIKGYYQAANTVHIADIIRRVALRHGFTPDNTLLHSMWFHDSGHAIAYMSSHEGWHSASHAHTSDIYDDRMLFRSRRIRNELLKHLDFLMPISRNGHDYLCTRFPERKAGIVHSPLGSIRLFEPHPERKQYSPKHLTFVTVARLDPIKRLDLIMELLHSMSLRLPGTKITWTLIGDGHCMEQLQQKGRQLMTADFTVEMKGMMENEDIQRYYATGAPDWFILMSSSEGVPVSMGEAMSYGIPVITTDVGEVKELADDTCAILLPRDATVKEYTDMILQAITSVDIQPVMSAAAMKKWDTTFNASRFASEITSRLSHLFD